MLTDSGLSANILSVYHSATPENIAEGMEWYNDAHSFAVSLDSDTVRSSGIIAALSPLSGWSNNKAKARQLYAQEGIVQWNGNANGIGLSNNVRKAERIYHGESPYDLIVRPKTRAFFETILDPTGDHNPVIDRHAFDIAMGEQTGNKAKQSLGRKGEYARFATAYREASQTIGIGPAQLQAIVWVAWRESLGKAWYG